MLQKILDNTGTVGLVLLAFGLVYYSVVDAWDLQAQIAVYAGLGLVLVYVAANWSGIRAKTRGRRFRLGGTALAGAVLVIGILALVNFLNTRHHKRVDLSEGGMHTLSEQTRKVLENLDRDIEVIGFFSQEPEARQFQDRIQEYKYITSRIRYEIIDPQKEPGRVAQYDVKRDGQVVVAGPTKKEIIDEISEEKLTNAIIKVTRDLEKKVYFLTGHGERSLEGTEATDYSNVKREIEKQNYVVESFNLAQENRIPEDASVIVSAGPKVDFFPNEVQLLEQYLSRGGKFFLLLEPDTECEMNGILGKYGITVTDKFVVDASGLGQLFGFGAASPLAADYADHPITRDLAQTMTIFPTARSVQTTESTLEYSTQSLVRTSSQSWGEADIQAGEVSFDEGVDEPGPVTIAVVSTKSVEHEESGSDESEESSGEENEPADASNSKEEPEENRSDEHQSESAEPDTESQTMESRIVVFGDSDFASNAYFDTAVNGDLFLNVVSWMAEDTDLLSIRPRDPENRSVTLTSAESRLIFWATVIFFPLATVMFGIAVWYRRR